jgi:predicted amidohydrolase
MKFRVALLQISPFGDDQDKNLAKGVQTCRQAKALGADLAVFPEL